MTSKKDRKASVTPSNAERIDHIGIAVADLDSAIETFTGLLGAAPTRRQTVAAQRVQVAAFEMGESSIELLQGTDPDSVISKFVSSRGQGLHHICLQVDNLEACVARLRESGYEIVDAPREGMGGTRVAFVHPRSAHGVLIELVESTRVTNAGG